MGIAEGAKVGANDAGATVGARVGALVFDGANDFDGELVGCPGR